VVFLDVDMPGTNGVEALKLAVAEAWLKHGAPSYAPKPFSLVDMDHMAAVAVEQRRDTRRP
jgi:DNA-binding NtrC family response regulator